MLESNPPLVAKASALLRRMRVNAGLTQIELAKRLNTTQSSIAAMERGGRFGPTVGTMLRVADACECKLLLGLAPKDDPNLDSLIMDAEKEGGCLTVI